MNITITSRKFKAKDSLKDAIKHELEYLDRFYDGILDANVVLSFTHLKDSIKTAEIRLQVPGKILLVSESAGEFSKAVNFGVAKLARQLKRLKSKKRTKV